MTSVHANVPWMDIKKDGKSSFASFCISLVFDGSPFVTILTVDVRANHSGTDSKYQVFAVFTFKILLF